MRTVLNFDIYDDSDIFAYLSVMDNKNHKYKCFINGEKYKLLNFAYEFSLKNDFVKLKQEIRENNKDEAYRHITFTNGQIICNRFNQHFNNSKLKIYNLKKSAMSGFIGLSALLGAGIYLAAGNNGVKDTNIDSTVHTDNVKDFDFSDEKLDIKAGITKVFDNYLKENNNPASIDFSDDSSNIDTEELIVSNNNSIDAGKENVQIISSDSVITDSAVTSIDNAEELINTENIEVFNFDYEDRSVSDAVDKAKRHMVTFNRFSKIYGIDANLLMAIMAQESGGIHLEYSENGHALGGMQIEDCWYNEKLVAYNFEECANESIKVNGTELKDFDYNVKVAAMILQNCLKTYDYDIPKAVQAYNMGINSIKQFGNNWINSRDCISSGDPMYFEHVFSYLPNNTTLSVIKDDGSIATVSLKNNYQTQKAK